MRFTQILWRDGELCSERLARQLFLEALLLTPVGRIVERESPEANLARLVRISRKRVLKSPGLRARHNSPRINQRIYCRRTSALSFGTIRALALQLHAATLVEPEYTLGMAASACRSLGFEDSLLDASVCPVGRKQLSQPVPRAPRQLQAHEYRMKLPLR